MAHGDIGDDVLDENNGRLVHQPRRMMRRGPRFGAWSRTRGIRFEDAKS
jgi:hypothetical protein